MDRRMSVQRSIDYIEGNLDQKLSLRQIARAEGFSPFHFGRLFQSFVGMPIMSYIRSRRLAHAAGEIAAGRRILDAALSWGFETHAGFTKAFRKAYGMPPGLYRIHGSADIAPPVDLSAPDESGGNGGVCMDVRFVARPPIKIAGYALKTTTREGENKRAIPLFWQEYLENRRESLHCAFSPVSHSEYGMCLWPAGSDTDEFHYVIGLETADFSDVPEYLFKAGTPAATYAVFTSAPAGGQGLAQAIQDPWAEIYSEWFPGSGYEYAAGCSDFELYDGRSMLPTGRQIEIWVPVVKKQG